MKESTCLRPLSISIGTTWRRSLTLLLLAVSLFSCQPKQAVKDVADYTYLDHLEQLQDFQDVDGKMAFIDEGEGPAILLVHGVPTSSWLYRKMIPDLVKAGYRVIAPDLLGYGASEKPDGPELYAPEQMGRRLLGLMEHLQIEEWTQVFHDGGGLWTWEMLALDATKVNRLIMLNTIVYQSGFQPPIRLEEGRVARTFAQQYATGMGQKMMITPTFKNGIKNRSVINDNMLEGYKAPFLNNGYDALYYFFTRTCNNIPDYRVLHRSLDIPLTVIWGEHDDMLVWAGMEDEVKANFGLEDRDIHLLDAKHFIQEEQPAKIASIIVETLSLP